MSEQNKRLVRRTIEEVWNGGRLSLLDEIVASDYLDHMPRAENSGPEGLKDYYARLHEAFPDIHFTIEDQIAEGDKVVTRWTARATHLGEYMGIAPSGNQGVVMGIIIDRIANGKFVEGWSVFDELGMMQQIGAFPTAEPIH